MIDIPAPETFAFAFPDGTTVPVPPTTVGLIEHLLKLDEGKDKLSAPRKMRRTAEQVMLLLAGTPTPAKDAHARLSRLIGGLTYRQLTLVYNHLIAAASGVDVETLAQVDERRQAQLRWQDYRDLICRLAARQKLAPAQIRALVIDDFRALVKAITEDDRQRAEFEAALHQMSLKD
jgi:hypothetical protein